MDKREHIRLAHNLMVWYQTLYEKSDFSFGRVQTKDISLGGMQMVTEDIDTIGTKLLIKFNLPGCNRKIEVNCLVKWVKRLGPEINQIGIQFLEMKQEDSTFLADFIKQQNYRAMI